jgi:hypothetical protein
MKNNDLFVVSLGACLVILAILRATEYIALDGKYVIGMSMAAFHLTGLDFISNTNFYKKSKFVRNCFNIPLYFLTVFHLLVVPHLPFKKITSEGVDTLSEYVLLASLGLVIFNLGMKNIMVRKEENDQNIKLNDNTG